MQDIQHFQVLFRLPPCGGSGLKFNSLFAWLYAVLSPSVWREWIEITSYSGQNKSDMSPSVWREWIEIFPCQLDGSMAGCLPPCGGSGLKFMCVFQHGERGESPSVWREWIEMSAVRLSVEMLSSLPPCGGSGLKCCKVALSAEDTASPSVWREWIEISMTPLQRHCSERSLPPCGGSGLKSG